MPWRTRLHQQVESWSSAGWRADKMRGHWLYNCGGGTEGFYTNLSFAPHQSLGLVLMTNSTGSGRLGPLNYILYDKLLGYEKTDWLSLFRVYAQVTVNNLEELRQQQRSRADSPLPSQPEDYCGTYLHPCGSALEIRQGKNSLILRMGGADHKFEHAGGYDFIFTGATLPYYGVRRRAVFLPGPHGTINALGLALEPAGQELTIFQRQEEPLHGA